MTKSSCYVDKSYLNLPKKFHSWDTYNLFGARTYDYDIHDACILNPNTLGGKKKLLLFKKKI